MKNSDPACPSPLYSDETVSDLLRQGMRLIQPRCGFRFGEDTVLLADFAARPYEGQSSRALRIADLGAGSGAATMLLAARLPRARFLSVELDGHSLSALQRNIRLNRLSARVTPLCADFGRWSPGNPPGLPPTSPPVGCFDVVVANPPYGLPAASPPTKHAHARTEATMSLESLVEAARCLLRPHGRLVLVHRSQRLTDVVAACRQAGIEPKLLRFVTSRPDRPPTRFLLSASRDARPGALTVAATLLIRDHEHDLSDETRHIYQNEAPMTAEQLIAGLVRMDMAWQERERDCHEEAF